MMRYAVALHTRFLCRNDKGTLMKLLDYAHVLWLCFPRSFPFCARNAQKCRLHVSSVFDALRWAGGSFWNTCHCLEHFPGVQTISAVIDGATWLDRCYRSKNLRWFHCHPYGHLFPFVVGIGQISLRDQFHFFPHYAAECKL